MIYPILVASILCVSGSVFADSSSEDETLYISEDEMVYLQEKNKKFSSDVAFKHTVVDEMTGKEMVSPLGNTLYPYSAMGVISNVMSVGSGQLVFKMSNVKASFAENQSVVSDTFISSSFYAVESDMVFLRSDGVTVTTLENASFVIIPEFKSSDLESLVKISWDECNDSHFRGHYDDGKRKLNCSGRRLMHNGFRDFIADNLLDCVNNSLESVDRYASPDLYLIHKGTAADKLHKSGSMHQQGKALDISIVRVTGSSGKTYDINYEKSVQNRSSWEHKFYKKLRVCWGKAQLERSPSCKMNNMYYNRLRDIPYYGSIGWEDKRHKKHLHISMPPCGQHKI